MPNLRPLPSSSVVALLSLLCLAAPSALAQWTYRSSPEPHVRGFSIFPNTPISGTSTMFVTTVSDGVLKGVDDGTNWTWTRLNNGLPDLRVRNIRSVNTEIHYAATEADGVYKTTDGGANWVSANGSGANSLGCRNLNNLAIGPLAGTIYASTRCRRNSGVYKTTDDGATWTRLGVGTIPDDTQGVSIQLGSGTTLFFSTLNYGLFRSGDLGATWTAVNNGMPTGSNYGIQFIDSGTTNVLTYVHNAGVFKSTDSGTTWALSSNGLPANFTSPSGISRDTTVSTVAYMGVEGLGVYRTTDSGDNWSLWIAAGSQDPLFAARAILTDSSGKHYIGTFGGVVRSTHNGATIARANMGGGGRVGSIVHDRFNPRSAYLASGVFPLKIGDVYAPHEGANVSYIGAGITGYMNNGQIYQDPVNAATLYATTDNKGIFKSTNGGAAWNPVNTGLPTLGLQNPQLAIDAGNNQVLYLGLADLGIFKSTDGGGTWAAINTGLASARARQVTAVRAVPGPSTTLFAATADGLYRTQDAGANWSQVYGALDGAAVPLPTIDVAVNPANPAEVYLANTHVEPNGTQISTAGIFRSINGGDTWTQVLTGKNATSVSVLADGSVYAGLDEVIGQPPVLVSVNAGASWTPFSGGLNGHRVRAFGTDAAATHVLSTSLENGYYTLPALPVPHDFNADGKPDLLWRHTPSGVLYVWYMNGVNLVSDQLITNVDPSWKLDGVGDFNGDGHPDIVWRNGAGETYVWYLVNGVFQSDAFLFSLPPEWVIQGVADFNKDGKPDFLMRNTNTGNAFAWLFNNNVAIGDQFLFNIDPSWKVEGVADLNADGQPDLLFRNMNSGLAFAWNTQFAAGSLSLTTSSPPIFGIDPVWEIVQVADWNADGKPDLVFRNKDTGLVFVWYLDGVTLTTSDFITQIDPTWEIVPRR